MAAPPEPRSSTERFQRVMRVFDAVVGLDTEARAERLSALAADDPAVRAEVEAMLALDGTTSHPISVGGGLERWARIGDAPAVEGAERTDPHVPVLRGQYRIVRQIGAGGMGVVYEAEQALPRRTVALKAVRAGFDSRAVLRRFEREAHILGRLHHPGIAQIYEAGASDAASGDQAFLAMEYVDGVTLTEWARGKSVRERVQIVATICDAVQHAHQRRVIHRDLKPANILVDRAGHPKVLDFGVARLADSDTAEDAGRTRAGQLVGTLPYMSPEQVGGDPDEIDARTDVWALGVVLYELLAGRLPFEPAGRSVPQMALAIRDETPPRLARLDRELAGDLDAIVSLALAKDRDRRYQSALELGLDLRRWLAGAPVRARQESALYVLRKTIARHRWIALSVAVALASLVAFAVNAKLSQRRADRASRELAAALRSSNIERGRLMAVSGNLIDAERLIWDEHLDHPDVHSHWALWDLYSKLPCERSFPGHTDAVMVMDMSPDGRLVATGSHDSTVRVWDWQSGRNVAVHPVDGFILGVGFGSDGRRVVCTTQAGGAWCWDTASGAEVWHASEPVLEMTFALSTARHRPLGAVTGEHKGLVLVDLDTGRVVRRLGDGSSGPRASSFDSTERRLLAGGDDQHVHVWDVDTGAELADLAGHDSPVEGVAWSPDDGKIASGDTEGLVIVHAFPSGREIARFTGTSGDVRTMAFARDGSRLLASCIKGCELWDLGLGRRLDPRPQFRQPSFAATFAPGDRQIVSGSNGGAIRVWEIESDSAVHALPSKLVRHGAVALAPGSELAARAVEDGRCEIVDLATNEVRLTIQVEEPRIEQLMYAAVGDRLACFCEPNHVSIWSTRDGSRISSFDSGEQIGTLRFSPDGARVAVTSEHGTVRVHDAASGAVLETLVQTDTTIERLAFSADGRRLATTHRGKRIEIWTLDPPRLERLIESPRALFAIAWDPSGERVWSGSWDGRVLVWSTRDGALLRTYEGHTQRVQGIVALKLPGLFASIAGDDEVRLWDADADVGLAALDARAGPLLTIGLTDDPRHLRTLHADGTLSDWDLGYYDRHIEGNAQSQRARIGLERSAAAGAPVSR